MRLRPRKGVILAAAAAAVISVPVSLAVPAQADPTGTGTAGLASSVSLPAVTGHLRALQAIADANGGTRAAGTSGYDASRDYVAGRLRKAGYDVTLQPFEFGFFRENSTAVMARISPAPRDYAPTPPDGSSIGDFATMTYSGAGDVTATVQAVDLTLPPSPEANGSTSGCEAADFAGFTPGNIALMQRGTCTFQQKEINAEAAGAAGVIIFNEGQPGRTATLQGTLGEPGATIPTVGASFEVGAELASQTAPVVRLAVDTTSETRVTHNVIAETRSGDPDSVVMLGAHLDSVPAGPGINDNGSGSAAILAVAERLGRVPTVNRLRFAWWSAEELGLVGSEFYVDSLGEAERARVELYLNFDMVASPNYMLGVYDGDDSDAVGAPAGPAGSAEIEDVFEGYFDAIGRPHVGADFTGRSDYGPFIAVGIPAGGLFTGAEVIKSAEHAALFGGVAGEAYDQCYHQNCDTFANINQTALAVNTGAIATAAVVFAFSRDLPGGAATASARTAAAAPAAHDHALAR